MHKSLLFASLFSLLPAIAQAQCNANDEKGPATIAEIVSFQLSNGVDRASFAQAATTSLAFLCEQEGFVRRTLLLAEDGTWTDVVEWETAEAAQAAMARSQQSEALGPFMSSMDMNTLSFSYAEIVDLGMAH